MMKRIHKMLIGILAALILVCSGNGCRPGNSRIAFFIYDETDTFMLEMMSNMESLIPAGISTEVRYAGNSQTIQNQQIVELADTGVKLFVINAVDRLACSSIAELCVSRNIDIIFFNREPLEDAMISEHIFYVGAASESLGKKQADMAAVLFGNDFQNGSYDKNGDGVVQLAIIKGEQGHQDAEKRTDNCVSQMKALGFEVEVLGIEVANFNRENGYEAMKRLYALYGGEIELLFANNDDMALGAIDYLLEAGIFSQESDASGQPFIVIGVDGTAAGLDMIGQGLLYGTVLNDSAKQADAIVTLADYFLHNRELSNFPYPIINDHYIYVDGDIITSSNLGIYTK